MAVYASTGIPAAGIPAVGFPLSFNASAAYHHQLFNLQSIGILAEIVMNSVSDVFRLGRNITVFPVVHGSGDSAVEVRRLMLNHKFSCLAVPLPASFQTDVEYAVDCLPQVSVVLQRQPITNFNTVTPDFSDAMQVAETPEEMDSESRSASYVPIDPCQPVIAALRIARQERMARAFIDIETDNYIPQSTILPDPYALKRVTPEQFAAAVLPALPAPADEDQWNRLRWMAAELHALSAKYDSVLCLCSLPDWPWLRDLFNSAVDRPETPEWSETPTEHYGVSPRTLTFVLGELPFITGLYEQARVDLDDDENISIDGIKALMVHARDRYRQEFGTRARRITPSLLSRCLRYIRNLSLIERRFTPDLYTLVVAAKQTAGDQYAVHVAETAREYPWIPVEDFPQVQFGIDRARLPDGTELLPLSRLPGPPVVWRTCQLNTRPDPRTTYQWQKSWDPHGQCSWPPEDVAIERFRTHVRDAALDLIGNDLAKTEKFSASMKDGLDIRETLRNWHTGGLYVRVFPPARGKIDCVVMLFDSPADPRNYPWRITWHAEHQDESTLSLFATNFVQEMVGPGIALARYGGAMFLFPPRPVADIWRDPQFDFADTLEERLLAAALHYSREKHVALMSHSPPGAGWRRLASKYRKKIVHVPLARFGAETIEKLRIFHVLNGHEVRSYADHFIRKP